MVVQDSNMKYAFVKEITKVSDNQLGQALFALADKLPDYFWKIPASSTGKYHPQCDLGDGGLVRHSIMVATIADELVTSELFVEDIPLNHDIARAAGLFHDCLKNGPVLEDGKFNEHTDFLHPLYARDFIVSELTGKVDKKGYVDAIANAIASHMGKWNTSKYAEGELPVPSSPMEKLLHCADYTASRKWVGGLW